MGERVSQSEILLSQSERKAVEKVEPIRIPGREAPGLRFVLKKGNIDQASVYANKANLEKFGLVIVDNVKLNSWELGTDEYKLGSKPSSQALHHDAEKLMDANHSVGLYHPVPGYGQVPRQATTLFADSRNYWTKAAHFVNDLPIMESGTRSVVWKYIDDIKKGSESEVREALEQEYNSKPFLSQKLEEWGIDPRSKEGLIIHLLDSRLAKDDPTLAKEIYTKLGSEMLEVEWKPNMLVMFDNVEFVHGLGPIPEGGKKHVAGTDLEAHLIPTTISNLSKM